MDNRSTEQGIVDLLLDYAQVVTIWEDFCKLHSNLYEKTCDEYIALINSDIDELENIIELKEKYIYMINANEERRTEVINRINKKLDENSQIHNVSDLLILMNDFEKKKDSKVLFRLNMLLIDIIEKIQEQNKKNQYYLNKAIHSIDEIHQGFTGMKKFKTYTALGTTQSNSRR